MNRIAGSSVRRAFMAMAGALVLMMAGATAHAYLIVYDGFNYGTGTTSVEIRGQNGGQGWSGAWDTNINYTPYTEVVYLSTQLSYTASDGSVVVNGGNRVLEVYQGGNKDLLSRPFASYNGDEVYISFLIHWKDGTLNNLDQVYWSLANRDWVQVGVKVTSGADNDFYVKTQTTTSKVDISLGTTYFLVARLFKTTPGATNKYNGISLWVNPKYGDSGAPLATTTAGGLPTSLASALLTIGAIDNDDRVYLDELRVGTKWSDVVVPEPATMALLGVGLAALVMSRRGR